jgi:uncharacterized protein Usg
MQIRINAILFLLLLGCFSILLLSNADGDNAKLWSTTNKLTWRDFRDTIITNSDRVALTYSGIRLSYQQTAPNSASISVYSVMEHNKSWVDTLKKSDYILSHEQYHFNITEYWCRKIKKDLAAARFTSKNLKEKVESIRKEDFTLMFEMQNQYDTETKHSEIEPQQKKWERKIDDLLKSVEYYSAESMTVTLK